MWELSCSRNTFWKRRIRKRSRLLEYIKGIIEGYNKDGCFYTDGYYEYVKDKIDKIEIRNKEVLEERQKIALMSESEKEEYFDKKYKEILGKMEKTK